MTLQEFRASRRLLPIAQAKAALPHLSDLDFGPDHDAAFVYSADCFILRGPSGLSLFIETDEYHSTDLPLLEFVLWCWLSDSPEAQAANAAIWASPAPAMASQVPA